MISLLFSLFSSTSFFLIPSSAGVPIKDPTVVDKLFNIKKFSACFFIKACSKVSKAVHAGPMIEESTRSGSLKSHRDFVEEIFLPSLKFEGKRAHHLVVDSMIGPDFPANLQAIKVLGEGTFGKTVLVRDTLQPHQTPFVIKIFKGARDLEDGDKVSSLEMVKNEWMILRDKAVDLAYGDIIRDRQTGRFFIPMKYVEGERLVDRWKKDLQVKKFRLATSSKRTGNHIAPTFLNLHEPLTNDEANQIIFQLTKEIDKLHQAGIVHGDLAARNIILSKNLKPTMIDYGRARYAHFDEDYSDDIAYFISHIPETNIRQVLEMRKADSTLPTKHWDLFM